MSRNRRAEALRPSTPSSRRERFEIADLPLEGASSIDRSPGIRDAGESNADCKIQIKAAGSGGQGANSMAPNIGPQGAMIRPTISDHPLKVCLTRSGHVGAGVYGRAMLRPRNILTTYSIETLQWRRSSP